MRFTHGSRSRIQGDRVATSIRSMHSAVWLLAAVVVSLLAGSAPAFAQTIVSATGYSITFNGNQQAFFSNTWNGTSPQAPANIAWASGTGSAFALAAFGAGVHEIRFANDGVYGNNRSWMQQSLAPSAYIGVRFPAAQSLSSIAWGRDNGRNDTAIASGGGGDTTGGGGQYTDRTSGSYTLQFTTVASPGTSTPDGDWTTIGTITLPSTASGEFSPWFRHEFDVRTAAGNPIAGVTGIRIFAPNAAGEGRVIDEIEAYRNAWWTGGSAVWSSTTAWQTAASGGTSATPYAGDSVVFAQTTSATQAVTLGADQAARTMSFTTADPVAITAGGFNRTLTLGWAGNLTTSSTVSTAGIAVAAGAGAVTIGSQTAGEQVALSLNASQTWTNDSSNTLTLRNAVSRVASDTTSRTLTIAGSGNTTINGPIANGGAAGTLALAKSGSGTLTLAGNNSLTGTVTISSGTLRFGDGGAGSGVAGPVVNNGALVINVSNTASFAGGISGTGAFIQSGNGTAYLTGTNTYTGRTTISGGVLQAVNPASLYGGTTANWTAANISTGSGATLAVSVGTSNFTAANVTTLLGNLGGLGGAVNNNGLRAGSTIGVDTSAAGGSFTLSDSIKDSTGTGGGSIGLTKFGTGTLILTGTNMFTGPTTVSQGTLQIGDGGTAGSLVGNVVNNASLVLNRSDSVTFPGLLSGTGSVVQSGAGSIVFGGSNAFAGVVVVDAGTVLVQNSAAFGTGRASVAAGGLLAVNASGATVANDIALSGGTVTSFVATTGSGGSYSTTPDGLYGVHTFTATGTSTFSGYVGPVEVLLVGGGGGGGSSHGGGGGGGGFLDTTASAGLGGNPVVVGDGGAGGASGGQNNGGNGGTSSAFGLFAIGGGGGGMYTATATPGNGLNGGSGGGGGGSQTQSTAGAGTSGQGFGGGAGSTAGVAGGGGGGGGALATGSSASSRNGGQGGAGKTSSITGSSVTYAGGGGGGGWYTSGTLGATSGAGGAGGGGAGGNGSNVRGVNGTNGLGGGGGGGTDYTPGGGNGGSGIVIVRYALSSIVNDLQTLSGSVTVNATSTLDAVRGSGGLRFTGGMSGAGGLTIASTGSGAAASVIFDGAAKSYAGPTLINAGGDLRVNSDNSLATGAVTVNGRLGGSGSLGGAVTVNSGGVLSPGNSIESLSTGAVSFTGGSTYEYEVDSSAALSVGADFTKALGNLSLSGSVTLSLVDLAASPTEFANGTTFSLFNYTGSWNNGLFTVSGSQVADDGTFTFGLNTWRLDYNATAGGSNYSSEYTTGSFVNIVVVPEPGAIVLVGIGIGAVSLALRRRK